MSITMKKESIMSESINKEDLKEKCLDILLHIRFHKPRLEEAIEDMKYSIPSYFSSVLGYLEHQEKIIDKLADHQNIEVYFEQVDTEEVLSIYSQFSRIIKELSEFQDKFEFSEIQIKQLKEFNK